jgi:hypothetical protein
MKVRVCFEVEHTVSPSLIAIAATLVDKGNAECINEALEGVAWVLENSVGDKSEISAKGRASLISARESIDKLLSE